MHELGITLEIFDLLSEIMEEKGLEDISYVTAVVGELSGIEPDYFSECWKVARLTTPFEKTELKLEHKPAIAKCKCGCEYEMLKNSRICPTCRKTDYTIISGREFTISQIEAK